MGNLQVIIQNKQTEKKQKCMGNLQVIIQNKQTERKNYESKQNSEKNKTKHTWAINDKRLD